MVVGVIGAGTMGSGIAQAFAMTDGYDVRLCDIKEEFAEGGKKKIEKNINFLVNKDVCCTGREEHQAVECPLFCVKRGIVCYIQLRKFLNMWSRRM